MVPLIGYVDRFSARPGEPIAVKVSSQLDRPYRADLVRIIHADANPAGPGIKLEEVPTAFAGAYPSRFQPVHLGSCGVVVAAERLALPDPCTIVVRVQPSLLDGRPQTVLAIEGGPVLSVAAEGACLELADRRVQVAAPAAAEPLASTYRSVNSYPQLGGDRRRDRLDADGYRQNPSRPDREGRRRRFCRAANGNRLRFGR